MTREATRFVTALLIALLAAVSLAACGGSDDSGTTGSSSAGESTATVGDESPKGGPSTESSDDAGGKSPSSHDTGGGETRPVDAAPLRVSGGGSSQFRSKGGDNSIQDFGEEADEAELEEAAAALHEFYVARAEADWSRACSYLASALTEQLSQLAERSEELAGEGCPVALEAFTAPLPEPVRRESTVVDAASLREEDGRAFLIYRGAGGAAYAIPMGEDDGTWKVGALAGTQLL